MTGHECRRLREAVGLSRAEMARRLGITYQGLWRMERGNRPIRIYMERAIRSVCEEEKDAANARGQCGE